MVNCKQCNQPMTPITTVMSSKNLPKDEISSITRGDVHKRISFFSKTPKVRRGMSNWRACYPCDKIYEITVKKL